MSAAARRAKGGRMRRRDALHNWSLRFGPNMTPMVDVVMVILIFFMASAAFMGNEWFLKAAIPFEAGRGTNPAKPNDPLAPPQRPLEILMDVDANGNTMVTMRPGDLNNASLPAFLSRVARFPHDQTTANIEVVIRPGPKVPYRDVVAAHSACVEAGMYKVGIGVKRASAPTPVPR